MALSTRTVDTQEYGQVQLDQEGFKPTLDLVAKKVNRAVGLLPTQEKANPIAIAGAVGLELADRVEFLTQQFPVECMVRVKLGKVGNTEYATPILVVMGHSSKEEGLPISEMIGVIEDQHRNLKDHLRETRWGDYCFVPGCTQDPPQIAGTVEWSLMVKLGRKTLMLRLTWEIDGEYGRYQVRQGLCEPSTKVLTANSSVTKMHSDEDLRHSNIYKEWEHTNKPTIVKPDDVRQQIIENAVGQPQQAGASASAGPSSSQPPANLLTQQQAAQIAAGGGGLAALMPRMSSGALQQVTQSGELLQLTDGSSSAVALPWEQTSAPQLAWRGNDGALNEID